MTLGAKAGWRHAGAVVNRRTSRKVLDRSAAPLAAGRINRPQTTVVDSVEPGISFEPDKSFIGWGQAFKNNLKAKLSFVSDTARKDIVVLDPPPQSIHSV